MAGAITSGSDPAGYDPSLDGSIVGALMSGLAGRDEPAVREQKGAELQSSAGYNSASSGVFSGLAGGLGLPGAIIKAVLQAVVGLPLSLVSGGVEAVLGLFGGIPASQITGADTENLVFNPQFNVDLAGWTQVGSWSQVGADGHAAPGAASVVANSSLKSLTSKQMVCKEDDKVTATAWRKVVAGSSTGTPVQLQVEVLNSAMIVIATQTIASYAGAGNVNWVVMSGSQYTIPANGAWCRVKVVVTSGASAGTYLFDDVSLVKSGLIPQNLISGLLSFLNAIPGGNIIGTLLSSVIPGLDASKITTGSFPQSMISGLVSFLAAIPGGNIIGTLLSSVIPGLDASKITTGVFGTGFIPGLDISKITSGLMSGLTFITSLIPGLDASKITTGTFGDSAVPGVGNILDNIFNKIFGRSGTGRTHSDAAEAIGAQTDLVIAANSTLAQIEAALGTGNPDSDPFERVGSTLGAEWDTYINGSGSVGTPNGHDLQFTTSSASEYVSRKKNKVALFDNHSVSIVLASTPENDPIFVPVIFGSNDCWVRMSNFTSFGTRTGVRLRYTSKSSNNLVLSCFVGGSETVMKTESISRPSAGAILTLECGVSGVSRRFIGRIGTNVVLDYTEAGTTSLIGDAYRYRGCGGKTENFLGVTAGSGRLKQWTAQG